MNGCGVFAADCLVALLPTVFCGFPEGQVRTELREPEEIGGVEMAVQVNEGATENGGVEKPVERQSGASMIEQLMPEITTHALSYLDYRSLCRLSMTNSHMRKAANDDNAWKALYRKDFTSEQDNVTPPNGWKAYYAATRAVVTANAEFFRRVRERLVQGMRQFWLHADYVKCFHPNGDSFSGYNAVMGSWQILLGREDVAAFQIQDVRVRVMSNVAWMTMKVYHEIVPGLFNMTNIYELHDGRWYMVHYHCSEFVWLGGGGHGHGQQPVHV
ncbi:F-box protein SKIP8-like isoform X1 [Salvia splendens]|uniref:F-box protein SKIP8-like isoform X1 n=1 Tax=Salvia splendens TaxID=180675 RepID=UPI001102A548|nr:F-box protein SKIP8-like isoform X1 [Salvia splendens]